MLWFLLACTGPKADDTADTADTGDSAESAESADTGDTSETGETGESGDSADSTDSGDTSDTGGTPALVGSFQASSTWGGTEHLWSCDETSDPLLFWGYYSESLGNLSGGFACLDAEEGVTVSFISPVEGRWDTVDDAPLAPMWTDAEGHSLGWGFGDGTVTSWDSFLDTYERLDTVTIHLSGGWRGTWDVDGAEVRVSASWDVELPCPACPS